MKLTRLRVVGFKTFVEPTDFLIEPGLTGVVGPNGCGKSNLVEALRWVMGESSHKNMRASGMDDVIFSGSGGRPARNTRRGRRSPSTTPTARAPAAFNDADQLEVSRQIEREAGSTYRVNGKRGPRPRRAAPVRRRRHGRALARPSCARARSARSSPPSPRRAGASWRTPPASPASTPAATRRSCASRRPRTTSCASRTCCASSRRRSRA